MSCRWLWIPTCALLGCSTPPVSPQPTPYADPPLSTRGACEHFAGFENHAPREAALAWSEVHTAVRFGADIDDPFEADAALVAALSDATGASIPNDLTHFGDYAEQLPGGCATATWGLPNSPPETSTPTLGWTRPGAPIPGGSAPLLVDFRGVPEGPTLTAYLQELARVALSSTPTALAAQVRVHDGMRDEFFAPLFLMSENVYSNRVEVMPLPAIAGEAANDRRLGLLIGPRLAPSAARFALALRAQRRAVLFGEAVDVQVAESMMHPSGDGGIAFRAMRLTLGTGERPLPDRVPADFVVSDLAQIEATLVNTSMASLADLSGSVTRPPLRTYPIGMPTISSERDEVARVASLLIAHGAVKRFFPYWDVVDRDPDERLLGALTLGRMPGLADDRYAYRTLQWFSNVLEDSHGFVFALAPLSGSEASVTLPILVDVNAAGEPFIVRSSVADFRAGDRIVSVGGRPAQEFMDAALEYASSSASSRTRNGADALRRVPTGSVIGLRGTDGMDRSVTASAGPLGAPDFFTREHGTLADLGQPDLFYVNLDGDHIREDDLPAIWTGLDAARGLVLDLRGYPGPPSWSVVDRVLPDGAPGVFMEGIESSVLHSEVRRIPQPFTGGPGRFTGPIVLLTAPSSQSQAEHLGLVLQSADRVHVVGRPTAGANGNITGVALPGGFGLTFTGMVIRQSDGSTFHGRGVQPDELVHPSPMDAAAGIDSELARAIAHLTP